jgi:asparagine synthase (glutamine-hydrolysing)
MCGITGFWQTRCAQGDPVETLHLMAAAIAHRGPDDSGVFHDEAAGVGLAFRRLSVIDLSPQGHQPMCSASGRYVIVYNGEVYNFEEIRAELGSHAWRGHSDTEVMLEAIERWGLESAVRRFVGMFAFALWDAREQTLSLVRDRMGIKPLFFGRLGGDFVFASELKALRRYNSFSGTIDCEALALYMRHSHVPSPHCIYQGISKLKPGCILTLRSPQDDDRPRPYWSAYEIARQGMAAPFEGSDDEAVDQLQEQLLEAVRLRMIADVPLGAFLSGGLDSSTIVALMQAQSGRAVKTFTIGFQEDDYDEAAHARKVAAHLGTDHTELYLTPQDALDIVPLLPSLYDEPFADSSQIPTYLVSKLARRRVTVTLSGDGGDELFGGYGRYLRTRAIWNVLERLPRSARKPSAEMLRVLGRFLLNQRGRLRLSDKAYRLADYVTAGSQEQVYLCALSHWGDPSRVVLDGREPPTVMDSIRSASQIGGFEELMMLTDLVNYLPDDVLTKVDRASMAVSLEVRVPLLDHRVVEFAWRLPMRLKIRRGNTKWILRQVLHRYVPRELLDRPKMGFGVPMAKWLRGPLRDWAEDLLSETSLRRHGLFAVAPIRSKWTEHLSGARNCQNLLWDVLMFQDWYAKTARPAHEPKGTAATDGVGARA